MTTAAERHQKRINRSVGDLISVDLPAFGPYSARTILFVVDSFLSGGRMIVCPHSSMINTPPYESWRRFICTRDGLTVGAGQDAKTFPFRSS